MLCCNDVVFVVFAVLMFNTTKGNASASSREYEASISSYKRSARPLGSFDSQALHLNTVLHAITALLVLLIVTLKIVTHRTLR